MAYWKVKGVASLLVTHDVEFTCEASNGPEGEKMFEDAARKALDKIKALLTNEEFEIIEASVVGVRLDDRARL